MEYNDDSMLHCLADGSSVRARGTQSVRPQQLQEHRYEDIIITRNRISQGNGDGGGDNAAFIALCADGGPVDIRRLKSDNGLQPAEG